MARLTTSLTATQIKQAKPKEKEYSLVDGNGLSLRIRPNGAKAWMFNYYVPITKKRNKISFGNYPDVSLAFAREQRDEARKLLAQGIDPKAHKLALEQSKLNELTSTFSAFADEYLAIKKETTVITTYNKRARMVDKYLRPAIGHVPVTEIKPMLMKGVLDPIAKQGKIETVKRICIIANEIMRIAVVNGAIEFNPLVELTKLYPSQKVKHNPALTPEELPELVASIDSANLSTTTRNLILWQLHTMVRPSEAATAKWSQIDFEEMVWVVPVPKMHTTHTVPITPQALSIIENMKPISGHREYIFPADRNPKTHANTQTANAALKRIGFKDRTTAHGLRGLASTTLNAQGFDGDVIESALSHQEPNKIRRAYNHSDYLERRKPVMCWWSDRIEQASKGETLKVGIRGLRIA
ncbi:integrase arm-type DNA-binding domain-containing protein [Vibrio diazotrophicus]|uniref:integrase arm-type DNA-binding domain-containing protein n=1 Tax=Vibrio diazotrophicus TaxID=685 RepID=UPI0005A75963|nr:integrase arm-type DNA-binding domain-containing protein [Vibrio diazotrophicus]MCZ4372309.1 tyrosine-type recombinase/integrase [Vibrio diazotrophicus]